MAPHANKRNNRSIVTEKNKGSEMHTKKLLFLYIIKMVIAKIRQRLNIIFRRSNSVIRSYQNMQLFIFL